MNTHSALLAAALCLSPFSALAGASGTPITVAQADVRIGPNGATVDRDRDRRRDRETVGSGERRDHDRNCRTVMVEERGVTRATRRCD
jgi:hypothetical protein